MNKCYIIGRQAAGREGCFRIQPEKHSDAQAWDSRDNAGLVVRYGDILRFHAKEYACVCCSIHAAHCFK